MILQALYDYYQRKAADPESNIAPQGFEWKEIPFLIVIDKDGKFINLEDTRTIEGKIKKAKTFLVIKNRHSTGKNAWQIANVLWDHYGYVLAHPKEKDEKKSKKQLIEDAQKQHGTFVLLVDEVTEKYPNNGQFAALKKFLEQKEQAQKVFEHEYWKVCSKILGCNLSFRIEGETKIVAEHDDLMNLLTSFEEAHPEESEDSDNNVVADGICLISGERGPIAVLHTATSIQGGKSGAKLVGFQKNSGYDSYYKEQGLNAPVSKKAEDAYTTALNVLLGKDSNNKFRISDTTILFWAEKETDFENSFTFFFSAPSKDDPNRNAREVKALFESIHSGKLNVEGDTSFYILGLAPNAARISVRFWKTGKVKDFAGKIALHFSDLEIIKGKKDEREYFTLFNLLSNVAFEYKLDNIPPNLAGKVIECILDGLPYPVTLQQQCIRRIRADQHVNRIRAAILKAYLNRKNRVINHLKEKEITMALDLENTNQGYLCGRLFAVLEKIQEEAQPGINSTIKDRFYGAASATPITVFSRLITLSNHHIAKKPSIKVFYEKLKGEIIEKIDSNGMPAHLSLDDQSRFAIGYYHQRQNLFTKKETKI